VSHGHTSLHHSNTMQPKMYELTHLSYVVAWAKTFERKRRRFQPLLYSSLCIKNPVELTHRKVHSSLYTFPRHTFPARHFRSQSQTRGHVPFQLCAIQPRNVTTVIGPTIFLSPLKPRGRISNFGACCLWSWSSPTVEALR